ncbi:hypothetical protein BV898_10991 [Hypsibius exemplaris]|uniref:UBA-like domain-containing protein n=1 Tax=Hypsibius exemplaris TaxID=2072580 RepID=A0A1W0WI96_HYPEX|nr:hypothetical protein BV898_10991 [Hypsibius exemplaris]
MDALRQSVMINQFSMVTGATYDEASASLQSTNWQLESALSMFFQGQSALGNGQRQPMDPMCAPANTPATPPNFSDALLSFSKMSTASPVQNGVSAAMAARNQQSFKAPQAFPENQL